MTDDDDIEYLQRRGDVIGGRYVLGDVLGVGGMGVVYAAVQRSLDRKVAIKMSRPEVAADAVVRERFQTEARAAARVAHRNVVRVLDFGDAANTPYLVMELVAGQRLGELVRELGAIAVASATELVRQLLAGLEEAHANAIVHADVKCDNILVERLRNGTTVPRLIDFGIARFVDDPSASFADPDRLVSGTPEYLAPEVIRGELPTFASDVYAAGTILYELVTGGTPFGGGTSAQIMTRQLEEEPVPASWRRADGDIPEALDRAIARALAKRPGDRFPDAAAFGIALDRAMPAVRTIAQLPDPGRASGSSAFATETTTVTTTVDHHAPSQVEQSRRAIVTALRGGNPDAIVIAYLGLARALVDEHDLSAAITELELGIAALARMPRAAPLWRLWLTLAAFYDGVGDRGRARRTSRVAYDHAMRAGSTVGVERAQGLSLRLARDRRRAGRPRGW